MIRTIPSVLFAFFAFVFGFQPVLAAADSTHLWSKAFGSPTGDQGNAVATDASGNVYLTGSFTGTVNFAGQNLVCGNSGGCLFLAKFAPDGTPLWSKSFSNDYGYGKAVATDVGGNVFLAGVFANADFGCGPLYGSIFAVKLTPDGSCLWSKRFRSVATGGTGNAGGNDLLNGLAIDAGGDVFLAGKFGCNTSEGCGIDLGGGLITSPQRPSYGGIFLAKLSGTNGSHYWSKAYGGASGQDYATGVAVDASGDAFLIGYFSSSVLNLGGSNLTNAGSMDVFLAKCRGSDGAAQWSKRFGGVSNDYGMAISVDSGGAAVITGQFQATADFGGISLTSAYFMYPDVFLARYAGVDGATLWAKRFGDTPSDAGLAIATDANGRIVITGYFMGTVGLGNGLSLTSTGGLDGFLAQYNAADGSALWAKGFGGASTDLGQGIAIDTSGNMVITGRFAGPADFGGGPINGGGTYDIFLAKYGSLVSKANTTTTLTSSLNPSTSGQLVTFTATVSPSAAPGTVTFFDGATSLGSGTLSGGTATYSSSTLTVGSHSITARYGGDTYYTGSTSPVLTQTVNTGTKTNTTTTLISSPNPSTFGQSVTCTATVSPSAATGTVTFRDGATTLGSWPLSGGIATYSTSTLTVGSHSITATYNGDSNYNSSTSPVLTQTVNTAGKTNTTTTLAPSLNPSTYGQAVTFTATVSPSTATGSVTFFDGATTLGAATVISGRATLSTSGLAGGTHSITASYGGDSSYNGSTSAALVQTINRAGTTTTLASSPNPSTSGQAVTFTATVSPSTATGTVTFRDGATTLGTTSVISGRATLSTSSLTVGTHSITATYDGDGNYNTSSSAALTQTVNTGTKTNTTTTLTSSLNPSAFGQLVTFTATVSPSTATGTVWFYDGATTLGSGTLSGGIAIYSTSTLSVGNHSIAASYPGDSNYNGSATPYLTQTVNSGTRTNTTTALSSSPNPSTSGQMVTFRATVSPSTATGTVTFRDGTTTLGTVTVSGGIATYSTSTLTVGTHSITATYNGDSNYNGSTSNTVSQTVNSGSDTTPPAISITSPASGSTVSGTVPVAVSTWDNVGTVRVELYVDNALKATSTTAPFTTMWKVPGKRGPHALQTRAYDASGNSGISQIVNVQK